MGALHTHTHKNAVVVFLMSALTNPDWYIPLYYLCEILTVLLIYSLLGVVYVFLFEQILHGACLSSSTLKKERCVTTITFVHKENKRKPDHLHCQEEHLV